jgi:dolichol-phosphate mannosyltransferase
VTRLVVVVPTYHEAGTLEPLADALLGAQMPGIELRIVIVDDGSTDGTAEVAAALAGRMPDRVEVLQRGSKRGLGSAYAEGFARALERGAELIAQMDADLSHEPAVLAEMALAIRDADLVIGSRYVPGGGVDSQWAWHRKLLSWAANRVVVPLLLGIPVTDATSGFRLWRREALARAVQSADLWSSGYGFQVELAYLAHRAGCRIVEVPIYFRERGSGVSKLSTGVGLSTAREVWSMRRRHRR